MSDEILDNQTELPPEDLARARELGWSDQEHWRGKPEDWIDAATFLERGERIMPFIKRERDKLLELRAKDLAEIAALKARVDEGTATLEEFRKFHEEATEAAYKRALADLKAEKRAAKAAGDDERVDAIEEQIDELREAGPPKPTAAPKPAASPAALDPVFVKWQTDNAAWLADPEKQAYAQSMASYIRATNSTLVGRAFLDRVTEEVEKHFGGPKAAPKSDGGGAPPPPSGGARSYGNLPADAKAACDRYEKKMVGPGKPYKDQKAWRDHYVSTYDWS